MPRSCAATSPARELLYVPDVYWDYCRPEVMVMERIHGVLVSDMDELRRRGTNIQALAENGVEIFFTQVFRHNFFHADMHPGNIFVQTDDPQRPVYAAVDFGIVGSLDARDQHYLAENFLAFFDRDYNRVARLHVDSGWVPKDTRVDELEAAIRTVCEPIFNKPLSEISFAQVLMRAVRDRAPLRHARATAADPAAEDPAADRGPRPPAVPAARPVEDGAADHAGMGRRPAERPEHRPGTAPAAARPVRVHTHAAAAAAAVRAEGVRRHAPHPGGQPSLDAELRREIQASARRRDQTIVGAAVLLAGILWLAFRTDWMPGVLLTAAGLLTALAVARRGALREAVDPEPFPERVLPAKLGKAPDRLPAAASPHVSSHVSAHLDPGGQRPGAEFAVFVEDGRAAPVLAAFARNQPAQHHAGLADVHATVDVRLHLAEQHRPGRVADRGEVAGAIERGPVKLDGHLAVAAVQVVRRNPGRGDHARVEQAREDPHAVAAATVRAAHEAIRERVLAKPHVVL